MSKRRGLGKGLQALIPVKEEALSGNEKLTELRVEEIRPAHSNARKIFDQEKIEELASSIKEHGVIQPVVVRPLDDGGYELIAGERRWRACKTLGYDKIPAVVKECKDLEATAVSLIENVQREDLNPLEEAMAYQKLMKDFGLTQEEVSVRVGKSRPFVANMVRLLALPDEIKEMLASGRLNAGHAKALLAIQDGRKQLAAAGKIAKQQLSVRQAEEMARALAEKKESERPSKKQRSQYILKTEEKLKKIFGARVKIKESAGGGGKLEINFDCEDDLNRILEIVFGGRNVPRETF